MADQVPGDPNLPGDPGDGGVVFGTPPLKTPNITLAQIVGAALGALYPVLTLLGVHLSPGETDALDQLKFIALGLFAGDATIRVGRALGNRTS